MRAEGKGETGGRSGYMPWFESKECLEERNGYEGL